ncbi:hypothetical protein ABVK25_000852 [Lepraria finkii]|uniref:Uncharacterized protein n=1 Tax=Lepraria finkii TaxID=1340010 RepID=A0ABR4BP23_9LECA
MLLAEILCFAALAVFAAATDGITLFLPRVVSSCIVPTTGPSDASRDTSMTITYAIMSLNPTSASTMASPVSSSASRATAPYATGLCSLHMTQRQSLADEHSGNGNDGKYGCEIRIFDAKGSGSTIGWQLHMNCSTAKTLTVDSKLSNPLVVTPEAKGDYVQFTLGTESWASTDSGPSQTKCNMGHVMFLLSILGAERTVRCQILALVSRNGL